MFNGGRFMQVNIEGTNYTFTSDFDPVNIFDNSTRGWQVSAGDYFKFPVRIGPANIFIKRFQKQSNYISGFNLLRSNLNKSNPHLPKIYDLVKTKEGDKEVYYLFQEFLQGEILEKANYQGFDFNPYTLLNDVSTAFNSLTTSGFWFTDFDPKNIFVSGGRYYLIDIDSCHSLDSIPNTSMWGGKDYWSPFFDYARRVGIPIDLIKKIRGDVLNQWNLIFLLALYSRYIFDSNASLSGGYTATLVDYISNNPGAAEFREKIKKSISNNSLLTHPEVEEIMRTSLGFRDKNASFRICYNEQPPLIAYFEATKTKIRQGEEIGLSWVVSRSKKIVISPQVGVVTGTSIKVRPSKTTAYVLQAENEFGKAECQLDVHADPQPEILEFKATPSHIVRGKSTKLNWRVLHARIVKLWDGKQAKDVPLTGSLNIIPTTDTIYELQAFPHNGGTFVSRQITVKIVQPARIDTFTTTPQSVMKGSQITVNWKASNVVSTSIKFRNKKLDVPPSGKQTFSVDSAGFVTLEVIGHDGEKIEEKLYIDVAPLPEILRFKASPDRIFAGNATTIKWQVIEASLIKLSDVNQSIVVPLAGSHTFYPTADTTYKLEATSNDGQLVISKEVKVKIIVPASIVYFHSTGQKVIQGREITISWQTEHAAQVFLIYKGKRRNVSTFGKQSFTVDSTDFVTLQVVGHDGTIIEEKKFIEVLPEPTILEFKSNLTKITANELIEISWKVYNVSSVSLLYRGEQLVVTEIGSLQDSPTATTNYKLKVVGLDGTTIVSRTIQIKVSSPIVIEKFEISPVEIKKGEQATLKWIIHNATEVELITNSNQTTNVYGRNSLTVYPNARTQYRLRARNEHYEKFSDIITVKINKSFPWNYLAAGMLGLFLILASYYMLTYKKDIDAKISQYLLGGIEAVENENYEMAIQHFQRVASFKKITPQIDSLSREYYAYALSQCELYKSSNSPNLFWIADRYFEYAAVLTNQSPSKCE